MNSQAAYSHKKLEGAMNPEQFTQIVDAILAGKYSWACVLLLRFAGHNPLHYIPYRTYNRLIKENCQAKTSKSTSLSSDENLEIEPSQQCLSQIRDLTVLEEVVEGTPVRGGSSTIYSELNWHRDRNWSNLN